MQGKSLIFEIVCCYFFGGYDENYDSCGIGFEFA